jgi:anti-sigma factor RsiW
VATSDDSPIREEELAALADGTLDAARQAQVMAAVDASPELSAALAEQVRVMEAVRLANTHIEAPLGLRERLAASPAPDRAPRRRLGWMAALASAVAAVVLLALVVLPGGAGGPTVAEAAGAVARPPVAAAPAPDPDREKLLDLTVDGVAFPDYAATFGWTAVGTRTDEVEGRTITTVVYEKDGRRVAYGIVDGDALERPADAATVTAEGTPLALVTVDGTRVVTWERDGHTCVMLGDGVPEDTLTELAGWKGKGAVEF